MSERGLPEDDRLRRHPATPALEWAAGLAGAAFALVILGALGWQAVTGADSTPPILIARAGLAAPAGGNWIVRITVENRGGEAAADVEVEGALSRDGREVETSSVVFSDVPGRSHREGGLIFSVDPAEHELALRPLGWRKP